MNTISKELAYISDCLAYKLIPGLEFPTPPSDMDWKKLYALIDGHRLSGFFFALRENTSAWPSSFIQRLRLDGYQYSLYGDQCSHRIKTFLEAMGRLGVRVIVLKGWAHIQTIYGRDYSQRLCEDIDILVHPKDVDIVEDVLRDLGYFQEMESWPGYARRYNNGTRYFVPNTGVDFANTFSVGLHWGLMHVPSYDPSQINVNFLFANAVPLDVLDVPVLQLGPDDEVVYLCGHIELHHRFDGALFRYYELASLIVKYGVGLDWQKIINTAIHWRHVIPVQNVLRRIDQLWLDIIPAEVLVSLSGIKPDPRERFVDFWIRKTRGSSVFAHLLMWVTFPRVWDRPLIALQDVFPAPEYMTVRYGRAPLGFWPLLYVRRLFRALRFLGSKRRLLD